MKKSRNLKAVLVFFMLIFGAVITQAKDEGMKKIVMVKDDNGDFFNAVAGLIDGLFQKNGFTRENSEYITLSLEGKEEKKSEVLDKIKEINPDVVMINTTLLKSIGMPLKDTQIPVVVGGGMEMEDETGKMILVNKDGSPKYSITGTYTMPLAQIENSFKYLNMISPIKNKKVVFATYPSAAFTKAKVTKALKNLKINLKEFKEVNHFEDYQEFVKKYDKDKEVGWIICGEFPTPRKNGKSSSMEEFYKWDRENNKKPNLAFWELGVQGGMLCSLAIDSMTTVGQMVDMGTKILKGEKVSNIKAEDPAKTLIILNQARAKSLGIEFPVPVLESAWKVYTDYDGKYIDKK